MLDLDQIFTDKGVQMVAANRHKDRYVCPYKMLFHPTSNGSKHGDFFLFELGFLWDLNIYMKVVFIKHESLTEGVIKGFSHAKVGFLLT